MENVCVKFDFPVSLILVDEVFLEDTAARADELAKMHPGAIVAAIHDDSSAKPNVVERILLSKAIRGVLPMNVRLELWLSVVRLMLFGGEYFPPSISRKRLQAEAGNNGQPQRFEEYGSRNLGRLTERERQILEKVSHGCKNSLIAAELDLSENTIKVHVRNIAKKLGAQNRTEAAAIFLYANGPQNRDGSLPFGN